MIDITDELKEKLLAAKSAEEAVELVKTTSQEVTAEDAERLWEEISKERKRGGRELSLDELAAVSGGVRNFVTEGCAATVEPGSDCWGADGGCLMFHYTYIYGPCDVRCPTCNGFVHHDRNYGFEGNRGGVYDDYTCPKCGTFTVKH